MLFFAGLGEEEEVQVEEDGTSRSCKMCSKIPLNTGIFFECSSWPRRDSHLGKHQ